MKRIKKFISLAVPAVTISMMLATPAQAETLFDRLRTFNTNMPVIKDFAIYLFFVAGLCGIGWAGMEMFKKSKGRGGEDTTWGSIGIKFIAGSILVALTATTDTMTQTFVGGTTSSNVSNIQ
jgi:hypothetical protein